MSMNLSIDSAAVKSAVEEAVLRSLDDEARENLIREALRYLTTQPQQSTYGTKQPSPLLQRFQYVCAQVVDEIAKQLLAPGTLMREQLNKYVTDALGDFLAQRDETFSRAIAEGLAEALRRAD